MTLPALRDDALSRTPDGVDLRLGLPWIRSLPLSSLRAVSLLIDGTPRHPTVDLGGRRVDVADLADERSWWFIQDRVVLHADEAPGEGVHTVTVSFELLIPYLQAGPDGPLVLPFRVERALVLEASAASPSVSRDVG